MRIRRGLAVLATVDGLRERHPELRRQVRSRELHAVFAREEITVIRAKIRRRAFIDGNQGVFVITMRAGLPAREQTKVLLHEYGHRWLHLADNDDDMTRQLLACSRGDIREREADLFAALLWLGPEATPAHPLIAPLYARVEAPGFIHRPAAQIPLPLPQPVPMYRPPGRSQLGKRQQWWTRAGVARKMPGATGVGVSHNALRFDMKRDGRPLGFFHYVLGWLDVYDRMVVEEGGRRRSVMLKCGDSRAQHRMFVVSTADRRLYTFTKKERRRPGIKELDRQILLAKALRLEEHAPQRRATDRRESK